MAETNDIIFYFTFIFEIGSVISIILLLYCLYLTEKIKKLFPGGNIVKKWIVMQVIIIIFIFFYVLGLIFIFNPDPSITYVISGILNLFTGFFVLIIVNLTYRTYKIILYKNKES